MGGDSGWNRYEKQERPDVIVDTTKGKIGIEITSLHDAKLKRAESECEKAVSEAQKIYETLNLPPLQVTAHISGENSVSRKNRRKFSGAIANIVAENIPPPGSYVAIDNHFEDAARFPYEIDFIHIFRYSWPDQKNFWTAPSGGFYREDFIEELQRVISEKDSKLSGYMTGCVEQWLLVMAENSSASTFFDPSETTINYVYKSSFHKVFVLELFKVKLHELKLIREDQKSRQAQTNKVIGN